MENIDKDFEKAAEIYGLLSECLYDFAAYKALHDRFNNSIYIAQPRAFWRCVSDNCLMMGFTHWCKVFGSAYNNKTHYSKISNINNFSKALKEENVQFEKCVSELKAFRDKYISHNDEDIPQVPYISDAIKIIDHYDKTVLSVILKGTAYLIDVYQNSIEIFSEYLDKLGINNI